MTEITDIISSSARTQFILYWGDMGSQWGVNRSVAQIHALLFLSVDPMNAEQISDRIRIARSNVSNSLKELVGWKLIRRIPVVGNRREHSVAKADVWEVAMRVAQGGKEREIDPAMSAIDSCVEQAAAEPDLDSTVMVRMLEMQSFLATADRWSTQMLSVPKSKLNRLMKMGGKIFSLLKLTGKKSE